jgi:hypothetical protein
LSGLPRPPWLAATGFTETREKITVAGQSMTLFTRTFEKESSMTFVPNTEDSSIKTANMYLIFAQKNAAK